jgi:transposase-like protein
MFKYSKLSRYKVLKIMECFCLDIEASKAAVLLKLNRNTINRHYNLFRQLIHNHQMSEKDKFVGVVEADESFFGPNRVRGRTKGKGLAKKGRATRKQPVFGIYERGGRVYTEIVENCSAATLSPIIKGKVSPDSVVLTDYWKAYDGLVSLGYDKYVRINKAKSFSYKGVHINGIEAFWSFTKRRLTKFNGVKKNFVLHLKECEWRYNKSYDQMNKELRRLIAQNKTLLV